MAQITCKVHDINKVITHVKIGGVLFTIEAAWDLVSIGREEFYTLERGKKAKVYARRTPKGKKYLTTHPDTVTENNLDELPECR